VSFVFFWIAWPAVSVLGILYVKTRLSEFYGLFVILTPFKVRTLIRSATNLRDIFEEHDMDPWPSCCFGSLKGEWKRKMLHMPPRRMIRLMSLYITIVWSVVSFSGKVFLKRGCRELEN